MDKNCHCWQITLHYKYKTFDNPKNEYNYCKNSVVLAGVAQWIECQTVN